MPFRDNSNKTDQSTLQNELKFEENNQNFQITHRLSVPSNLRALVNKTVLKRSINTRYKTLFEGKITENKQYKLFLKIIHSIKYVKYSKQEDRTNSSQY